jgi:hypothetical protein
MSAMGGNSSSRVQWVPSDSQRAAASTLRKAPSAADRTTAKLVVGLTTACTALALYDLFLLATGI